MNSKDQSPIFLVGTGRSGTTILYTCLAMHPDLAWVSSWVGMAPRLPMAVFNRIWDLPGSDRFWEKRFFPRPAEPMRVFPTRLTRYREETVDPGALAETRIELSALIRSLCRQQGRPRFLTKMAGRPVKSQLFAEAFPTSFIIHITRDLKPTVASLMQVRFYDPNSGLDPWPWGTIPHHFRDFYEQTERAPLIAAAIKVRLNRIEQDKQLSRIDATRWMEVAYSEFVAEPLRMLEEIGRRADLPINARFLDRIKKRNIYGGADQKWRKLFSDSQVRLLEEFESLPD